MHADTQIVLKSVNSGFNVNDDDDEQGIALKHPFTNFSKMHHSSQMNEVIVPLKRRAQR